MCAQNLPEALHPECLAARVMLLKESVREEHDEVTGVRPDVNRLVYGLVVDDPQRQTL